MHVVILFLALVLVSLKPNCTKQDYLDKDKTFCVRGIMMVAICFSHVLPFDEGNALLRFFFPATVAPFFFYSGYGLALKTEACYEDGEKNPYLQHFFKKRLSRMFCTTFLINLTWVILNIFTGAYLEGNMPISLIKDFLSIGWFATVIIVFYVAFYWIYRKRICGDFKYNVIVYLVFTLAFILVCRRLGLSSTWYGNSFAFPLGLAWAHSKNIIDQIVEKSWFSIMIILVITLCLCNVIISMRECEIITVAGPGMIAAFAIGILYPILWNLILVKIEFRTLIWHFIGVISFEMYLIEHLSHSTVKLIIALIGNNNCELYAVLALAIGIIYSSIIYDLSGKLKTLIFRC